MSNVKRRMSKVERQKDTAVHKKTFDFQTLDLGRKTSNVEG
jgi:hypothetical protein